MDSYASELLKQTVVPWSMREEEFSIENIFQLNNLYLVVQSKEGILIIDQHAAHERILYEQYEDEYELHHTISQSKRLR